MDSIGKNRGAMPVMAWKAAAVLAAAVALALNAGCRPASPADAGESYRTNVETWIVSGADLPEEVVLPGLVEAKRSATLSSEVAAPVSEVLAEEGQRVEAGAPLVRFDRAELEQAAAAAVCSVEALVHQLEEVEKGARDEQIREAEAMLSAAVANRDLARSMAERRRALAAQSVVPAEALDQAQAQVALAEADVRRAEETLALMRKGARQETLEALRSQIDAARASAALARLRLAKTEVRSPLAGVVRRRMIEPHEFAGPGQPLFEILEISPVVVKLAVPERIFVRLKAGDPVTVSFRSMNTEVDAAITGLAFAAERDSQTFEVRIEIANPARARMPAGGREAGEILLRPGLLAKVRLNLGVHRGAVAIPSHALVMDGPNLFVYVVEGGVARARPVGIGIQRGEVLQVTSGLAPGDRLVVLGQRYLRNGADVNVVAERGGEVRG